MQSRDPNDDVVYGKLLPDFPKGTEEAITEAQAKGAVQHTIAPFPTVGKPFLLGGLEYVVTISQPKRGKFTAKLVSESKKDRLEVAGETYELRDIDLHKASIRLANLTAREVGISPGKGHLHTSYISKEDDDVGFEVPEGKIVRVRIELVDATEANPPPF